jgi:hypothetical protein
MKIETIVRDGVTCEIWHDDYCHYMYDELWDEVTFISNHRDYSSQGQHSNLDIQDCIDGILPDGFESVPVNAYIHSGIALCLGSFECPWDSGVFGFLVFKKGEFGENNIGLKGFVKHWNSVLMGEVYGFTIDDGDSIGGFVGYDYVIEEANDAIDNHIKQIKKRKVEKLKVLIKNRVPLEKRQYLVA